MKRHDFKANWPAPDEYLLELGRMTTIWGMLESAVNIAISKLAGYESALDSRALIMVAHSNFQQRVDIVSSLCEQLAPEYPKLRSYDAVIKTIQAAQKARNKYAHNAVVAREETGEVTVSFATARGALKTTIEPVRVSDIKEATAKIHEAICALHTLVTGKAVKPLWER